MRRITWFTGTPRLYYRNMRKNLFHVQFQCVFSSCIYQARRSTATEAPMNRCCSQLPFGRWKYAILHKPQWVQKFRERETETAGSCGFTAHRSEPVCKLFLYFFFAIDYLWRPSRWSLNCTYKYMEKTPIQRNRTPNHYHATLLSSYQLICREE